MKKNLCKIFLSLIFVLTFSLSPLFSREALSSQGPDIALTLDECISIAMDNHFPLKIAKKQLKLAEFRVLEAQRNLGPTVTARWEESDGQVAARYYDGRKISVEGKQPVFYGGELVYSVKQAKVNLQILRSDYDRIKNELILQVKEAYYTLDRSKKALKVQKELQKETSEIYSVTKNGYDSEVYSKVEFLEVFSQQNQVNYQVIAAEEDISLASLLLQQAMNIDEDVEIVPVGEPEIVKLDLETCLELAYLNQPEIKIGRLSLEYYEYAKKINNAKAYWPKVDFLASYGNLREDFLDKDLGAGVDPRDLGPEYYVGTKVTLPFFGSTLGYSFTKEEWQPVVSTTQGTKANTHTFTISLFDDLKSITDASEAEIGYIKAQHEMNRKQQEVTLDVRENFFKYKKAIVLLDVSKSKIDFQEKQVEVLEIKRKLGEVQYSDVIEEMIKLAEERFSYLQAAADYLIAIASLNKAIGINGYITFKKGAE